MILKRSVMKQLFKPLVFILCAGALASCSKKVDSVIPDATIVNPISDYTVTPDAVDGFTFKFNNLSKAYTKYEWRFGDDSVSTEATPSHTYVTTGDPAVYYRYLADLKTVSTTNTISHKYQNVSVSPDDIIKLNAVKTAVPNQVQFTAVVKGTVKSYLWTIVDNKDPQHPVTTTSTLASPIYTFFPQSFNAFSLKITTDRGSFTTISRNITTEGIAINFTSTYTNNTPLYPALITNIENVDQGANEGASKLVDGNILTKFGYYKAFGQDLIITLKFPGPVTAKIYGLCNGNDSDSHRDPKEWYLEGSADGGSTWVQLDHIVLAKGFYDQGTDLGLSGTNPVTGKDVRFIKWFYFGIATPGAYASYRWRVTKVFESAFQMSEIALFR
jgi:hypothetical protein